MEPPVSGGTTGHQNRQEPGRDVAAMQANGAHRWAVGVPQWSPAGFGGDGHACAPRRTSRLAAMEPAAVWQVDPVVLHLGGVVAATAMEPGARRQDDRGPAALRSRTSSGRNGARHRTTWPPSAGSGCPLRPQARNEARRSPVGRQASGIPASLCPIRPQWSPAGESAGRPASGLGSAPCQRKLQWSRRSAAGRRQ